MLPLLDLAAKKGAIALDIIGCFLVIKEPKMESEGIRLGAELR